MGWQSKYWDIMEQIFWSLKYVGLGVIPEKQLVRRDGSVSVPAEMLGKRGRLYRHVRNAVKQRTYLLAQEEVLNHVFEIAYGIAPDSLIAESLLRPLGFVDEGEFNSIGREVGERYRKFEKSQFQQQDGFFVSSETAMGVELKLGSKSSPDQILKYSMLLALEEHHSGSKRQIGLLYILPDAGESLWKDCGISGPFITSEYFSMIEIAKSDVVKDFYFRHEQAMRSVLNRMVLGAISWADFSRSLSFYQDQLETGTPGGQCL